jgi:hypothetical protein
VPRNADADRYRWHSGSTIGGGRIDAAVIEAARGILGKPGAAILSFDLTSEIADVMVMICGSADSRPFCEVISVCIQPECLPEYPFEGKLEYYGKTGARSHYPFGRIVIQA